VIVVGWEHSRNKRHFAFAESHLPGATGQAADNGSLPLTTRTYKPKLSLYPGE
jgi:hypothetical protein